MLAAWLPPACRHHHAVALTRLYPPTIHTGGGCPFLRLDYFRDDLCLGYDGMHVLGGLAKDTMCRVLQPDNPRNSESMRLYEREVNGRGWAAGPPPTCASELLQRLLVTSYLAPKVMVF